MTPNRSAVARDYGGPNVIDVVESDAPRPSAGQVRVRVEASGIGATDAVIRKGVYPVIKTKPPFTLGYEFVGRIDAIGQGVTNAVIGQRIGDIVQIGANTRYLLHDAARAAPLADDLSPQAAIALPLVYMTALQMLGHSAQIGSGARILVRGGSGAVGSALLQLAHHFGIEAAATASAGKLRYVEDLGATAFDYARPQTERRLSEVARSGFDAVFDPVGPASFARSFRLLSPDGTLVTFATMAAAAGIKRVTPAAFLRFGAAFGLMMAGNALRTRFGGGRRAVFFGIVDSRTQQPDRYCDDLVTLAGLVRSGAIAPRVTMLDLSEVAAGHAMLDAGAVQGQLACHAG